MLSKFQGRGPTLSFGHNKIKLFGEISAVEIPFFCPICLEVLANSLDVEAYTRVQCCRACENDFAEVNLEAWKGGQRPTQKQIEQKLKERNSLLFNRYVDTEK